MLGEGLQSIAYDHIRAFTNPSFPRRHRKRKGHVPTQRIQSLDDITWGKLKPALRALFDEEIRDRWIGDSYTEYRRYRFRYPDLYRLQVRQFWITHRAVPTDAARQNESLAERYWFKAPYYEDLYYLGGGRWRGDRVYQQQKVLRANRVASADIEAQLADVPADVLRHVRIRP